MGKSDFLNVNKDVCVDVKSGAARLLVISALMLVALFLLLPSPSTYAAGAGRISGQILDGTKNKVPVAGQSVILQMAQGDTARDLTTVTTDAHGAFSFGGLDTDKTVQYAVYTRYQGAQYYTDLIDLSAKPVQQVNLTVYDATTSMANIAVVQASILLRKPDAQKLVMEVSELYTFKNLGASTYVGSLQASGRMPNALRFSLPHGARNVSTNQGFDGYNEVAVDAGFATNAAIPPGDTQFAFTFEVPYTMSTYDFNYTVVYPTVQLSMLVPPDIHASSGALISQGLTSSQQDPYQLFQARTLPAGVGIHVQLEGLPVASTTGSTLNLNTLWLVAALLIMLAVVFVTWFLYRNSHRPALAKQAGSRAGKVRKNIGEQRIAAKSSGIDSTAHQSSGASKDQQQALLQELLELDRAFEAGKMKKVEYQEKRSRIKAQLRRLMSADTVNALDSAKNAKAQRGNKGAL